MLVTQLQLQVFTIEKVNLNNAIENGSLFTGGVGTEGQLGTFIDEDTENSVILVRKTSQEDSPNDKSQDISNNNEMFEKYCFLYNVKTFGPNNKALKVSCGDNYTLVLSGNYLMSFFQIKWYREEFV